MLNPKEIKELRLKKGYSQNILADKLTNFSGKRIDKSTISKWENGKNKPSINFQIALESVLSTEMSNDTYTDLIDQNLHIDEKRNISGIWETSWAYETETESYKQNDTLILESKNRIVIGKSDTAELKYKILAYLTADGLIFGKWFSILNESRHHGVFLLELNRNGNNAKGRCLGTHTNEKPVLVGTWTWKKKKK